MDIAELLQLRDSGSSAIDSGNAAERNRQFNRILIALEALGAAFETSFIGGANTEAYTPTVTAGSGTFTSVAGSARYLTVGKFTLLSATISITTNGTAAADVRFTLPNTVHSAKHWFGHGREQLVTGFMLNCQFYATETRGIIFNYDNTYPGGSGRELCVSGWYEHA